MKLPRPRLVPAVGFVAWCLADLARDPAPRLLPSPVWTAAIMMFQPLGGIAWLVLGRSSRRRRRR